MNDRKRDQDNFSLHFLSMFSYSLFVFLLGPFGSELEFT
jgi:hypothetical protein